MSVFSKIMDSMKISNEPDDDDYYDDYDDYDDAPKKSIFKRNSAPEDDYAEEDEQPKGGLFRSRKSAPSAPSRNVTEVTMIKPASVEDARLVVDQLLSGKAVVLNMEGIPTEMAQRIIDFTSGATYSMEGKLQKISNYIFIATPSMIELSGDFQDMLTSGQIDISGMNFKF